jgi:spore germination protein YaaH
MIRKIFIFLILSVIVSAQNKKSVHQIESEYYSINKSPGRLELTSAKNFHQEKTSHSNLKKTVFGFLPSWEYSAGSLNNLRFYLLTHIAVAFFEADGEGNIKEPPLWPWTDLIEKARADSVKLIMALANFDSLQIHKLLTINESRQKLFNGIQDKIILYGFDGVNIDFENVAAADRGATLGNFLKSLSDLTKPAYGSEISFNAPAVNSGGWNFQELSNSCDYLFLMGYDYYGSWSSTTGPSAPLTGANYSLTYSLNQYYGEVLPEKIILGVPYYGNYWRTDSESAYAAVVPYDSLKTQNNWIKPVLPYKQIAPLFTSKEKRWDSISGTPWLRWLDTKWNQIWYDNEVSLSAKYDLAISKKLRGIGIWALGYDNGRPELWDLIRGKLTDAKDDISAVLSDFRLDQNYPNPFNPETVISYRVPDLSDGKALHFVSLMVFDLLGREAVTLVSEYQSPGAYQVRFNAGSDLNKSRISGGVYLYRIRIGSYSAAKKMILLK